LDTLNLKEKRSLIDPSNQLLTIEKQCELLNISRSSYYYKPLPLSDEDLKILTVMDEIYTKNPTYGKRRMSKELQRRGYNVGKAKARSFMIILGLEAVYPKPRLSFNPEEHKKYPYLLNGIAANKPNHIWGIDITYIRLNGGFIYLTAILDWYSRFIINWEFSTTLHADFCASCITDALSKTKPEIMNQDQGVQFTSNEYLNVLINKEVQISMDGKGRCFDNIFTERLWRTIKYEEVFLKNYQTVNEAKESLNQYINYYNNERLHSSIDYRTPCEVYYG